MVHTPGFLVHGNRRITHIIRTVSTSKIMILRVPDLIAKIRADTVPREPPVQHFPCNPGHIGLVAHKSGAVLCNSIANLAVFPVFSAQKQVPLFKGNGGNLRRAVFQNGQLFSRNGSQQLLKKSIIRKSFFFLTYAYFFGHYTHLFFMVSDAWPEKPASDSAQCSETRLHTTHPPAWQQQFAKAAFPLRKILPAP